MRAGCQALSLLAAPLNVQVLRALDGAPGGVPLAELRQAVGSPPQTTMRTHLRSLSALGIVAGERRGAFPGPVDYRLERAGTDLLCLARVVDAWLGRGELELQALGDSRAKSSVKALVDGWSSSLVWALAARPLALTDLNRLITALNYPALERRLSAMRVAGLVEPFPTTGRSTPYAATDRLRQAMGPLAAAVRWEQTHLGPEAPAIAKIDVEAALLLAVPSLQLPSDLSGHCRLVVELPGGGEERLAGVMVEIGQGQVASCVAALGGKATAWASGSPSAWLEAMLDKDLRRLEVGGDVSLARSVVEGIPTALYGTVALP
jgi:DNA-binding HxlR family transcriptional regulator